MLTAAVGILLVLIFAYAGFPALVWAFGKLRNRQVRRQPLTPKVSLVIAAYNEEQSLGRRLENALEMEYPPGNLEIIVASDGSVDGTESIASSFAPRVRLLSLPRRGKIHALNQAAAQAEGEILVFSDANTHFEKDALRRLAANFADPEVGGVAGNKVYRHRKSAESSSKGEGLYWSYDKWLKGMETLTGSTVSGDGAIYAIRRSLYPRIDDASVTDDFAISTAVIEQGFRLVFEERAMAYETAIPTADREFHRKVRLMTRGLRSVLLRKRLLNPFGYGFYSLVLFSHKVLRRLVPFFLIALLAVSLAGAGQSELLLAGSACQIAFYFLALAGLLLRQTRLGSRKWLFIPFFFCLANLAAMLAVLNVLAGKRIERWQPQRHGVDDSARPMPADLTSAYAGFRSFTQSRKVAKNAK